MTDRMKILIAYDGSRCADSAVGELWRAGLPAEADAVVVSVAESWLPPPSSAELVGYALPSPSEVKTADGETILNFAVEEARKTAEFGARAVRYYFPEWKVEAVARKGSPGTEILNHADEWNSDLIVVGSHGRSAVGRLLFGSVSHRVLTNSRRSVRISRGTNTDAKTPIRLVLALDGSVEAEKALCSITSRKWPDGTEVRILAVQDPIRPARQSPPFAPFADPENYSLEEARAWIQTVVETAADELKACGLAAFPVVRTGDPRQLLLDECELFKADCVFLGARGLNRMDRFLLGSVSTAIAMRAQCSVEIVH